MLEPTKALLEYLKKTKSNAELFDVPTKILLTVTFKLIPIVKNKVVKIKVPNGLKFPNQDVCLFVRDLKRGERDYEPSQVHFKELLASKGIDYISEVIPLKCLKLEYRQIEAKKNLCNKYDLFLADDRIFGNLPRTLGRDFARRKRIPIQVKMTAKDLKKELDQAVNNAYMVITGKGSCSLVHIANSNMTDKEIAANILMAAKVFAEVVPGGAENIRNIYIKTEDSPSLPVYIAKPGCDTQLPATGKIPKKQKPEVINWSLRAKAFVTENNDIYLCSKSGERKLLWGGSDFSNMPEKKRLLLRKKIESLKKGKTAKLNVKGKKKKKNKKNQENKMNENKKELKENGDMKEKLKIKKKKKIGSEKRNNETKASPKVENKIKKKKLKENLSKLKTAKQSVKMLRKKK